MVLAPIRKWTCSFSFVLMDTIRRKCAALSIVLIVLRVVQTTVLQRAIMDATIVGLSCTIAKLL